MSVRGQRYDPVALPLDRSRVRIVQKAGWASDPLWGREKLPAFVRRTSNPVASHYTDYATQAAECQQGNGIKDEMGGLPSTYTGDKQTVYQFS
jgi:hypothetical protein